jgi:hypothetical protein
VLCLVCGVSPDTRYLFPFILSTIMNSFLRNKFNKTAEEETLVSPDSETKKKILEIFNSWRRVCRCF